MGSLFLKIVEWGGGGGNAPKISNVVVHQHGMRFSCEASFGRFFISDRVK